MLTKRALLFAIVLTALAPATRARAQTDEIQVYDGGLAARCVSAFAAAVDERLRVKFAVNVR